MAPEIPGLHTGSVVGSSYRAPDPPLPQGSPNTAASRVARSAQGNLKADTQGELVSDSYWALWTAGCDPATRMTQDY